MQKDSDKQHPYPFTGITICKQYITQSPCSHSNQQSYFQSEPFQKNREQKHKCNFRNLPEGHIPCSIFHACIIEKEISILVIKGKWNTNKNRCNEESQKTSVLQ